MKVAILQNSIGIGGRSKVVAEVIDLVKDQVDSVDIHTLSEGINVQQFFDHYEIDRDTVTVINYGGFSVPGTLYQQPILNYKSKDLIQDYNIVFNSNNCVRFLPSGPEYIHYIHFPTSSIPDVDPKYNQLFYQLYAMPLRVLSAIDETSIQGHVFANSEYTLRYIQDTYGVFDAEVLYPPCLESVKISEFNGEGVISVGSFHPNKRQLFQIQMAKEFPETTFRIVGSKASQSYFENCQKYIKNHDVSNIEIYADISDGKLQKLLNQSCIFLHSMENEKFGIATVEGINQGCVPLVHNSGGQREVVPDPSYRYTNRNECKKILDAVLSGKQPSVAETRQHLKQFTESQFRERLESLI